jgi:tetratricopeptide (TPR) repeat protein
MKKKFLKSILILCILPLAFSCSSKQTNGVSDILSEADQRLVRGNELLRQGEYNEAGMNFIKSYTNYSLSDDLRGCGSSLTGLGISLFNQNRSIESDLVFKKAENYFQASKRPLELLSFYITKSLLLIEQEKFDKAEKLLKDAEKKDSKDQRLKPALALLELKKNNPEKAFEYLSEKGNTSFYFYVSGLLEIEKQNFEKALSDLEKALEKDKKEGNVSQTAGDLEALSNLYLKTGDKQKAKNCILRAIKIYILIDKIDRANKLIETLKKISSELEEDMSVENFFIELWMNR